MRASKWPQRALLLCLAVTGCMSVPVSTMVRMSTFDEGDFMQIDPEIVRVKIKLPQQFSLNPARSWLGVDISSEAGVHYGEFKLDQVSMEPTEISAGMFSGMKPGTSYTLALSAKSKDEFRKLQGFVSKGQPGDILIRVVPILSSFPRDAPSVNVWIDLLLEDSQGYFTLVDGAEIPMDRIRAASTEAGK